MSLLKPVNSIFLAEDDEDDVEIFHELIGNLFPHIQIQVAGNGAELIRLLQLNTALPDLIFLDMNMPIKNGIQCLAEIKAHAAWKSIRTIMLSTSSNPEQIELARQKGAECYLVKSTSFTQFQKNLAACINHQIEKHSFLIDSLQHM